MSNTAGVVREKPEGYVFGRPTKYRPEMCEQVVEWGKLGKSRAWMASELDVSKSTVQLWEAEHPDFSAAMTRAMAHAQRWWEDVGQENLIVDPGKTFSQSTWSRSMAARFPDDWRETTKQETELSGKNGGPVTFAQVLGKLTSSVCPSDDEAATG